MKLSYLVAIAIISAAAFSAQASPEEEIYIRKSDNFVVKYADDKEEVIGWLSHHDAADLCESLGARQMSSVELAMEATEYGSVMKKPNADGECDPEEGEFFDLVTDENGPLFCYSYTNYERPEGDLGYFWAWSSDLHYKNNDYAYLIHGLNGDYGYVSRKLAFKNTAARCIFED